MPFVFKKVLDHGSSNPIVARLSLQILEILKQCNTSKEIQGAVGTLYMTSLLPKLVRCWEIEERFKEEFATAIDRYKAPASGNAPAEVPQIARLELECHDFLYQAKNFIRDLLQVVNHLYGTSFKEASEFSWAKKGRESLVEFAVKTFGPDDGKTKMLKGAIPTVEALISMRNAVEHPDGFSGRLVITNFELGVDGKLNEPGWHREKDGNTGKSSSIRADMEICIRNLLSFGEDVFVGWASDNLKVPDAMCIALIPEDSRDPRCPVKWTVTVNPRLVR